MAPQNQSRHFGFRFRLEEAKGERGAEVARAPARNLGLKCNKKTTAATHIKPQHHHHFKATTHKTHNNRFVNINQRPSTSKCHNTQLKTMTSWGAAAAWPPGSGAPPWQQQQEQQQQHHHHHHQHLGGAAPWQQQPQQQPFGGAPMPWQQQPQRPMQQQQQLQQQRAASDGITAVRDLPAAFQPLFPDFKYVGFGGLCVWSVFGAATPTRPTTC